MGKTKAIILFCDIRGFTSWSERTEVFEHINDFIQGFYQKLETEFPPEDWVFKNLGDGAMLLSEIEGKNYGKVLQNLYSILKSISVTGNEFNKQCRTFSLEHGEEVNLSLGWGIARGTVQRIQSGKTPDYIGSAINKAARCCNQARPGGIVIDYNDFREGLNENPSGIKFFQSERILKGLNKVALWVSQEVYDGFLRREELRETPEVHIAGLCYRENRQRGREYLIAKRSMDREMYPGLYEGCGGQLRWGESFTQGVIRHFRSEMGLSVEVNESPHVFYTIPQGASGKVIPGIVFSAKWIEGTEGSRNHDELLWKTPAEIIAMDASLFIPGIQEEIAFFAKELR